MAKVGTAWIEVDADLDQFHRRVERELRGRFQGIGDAAGQNFSRSFGQGVNTKTLLPTSVERDLDRTFGRIGDRGRGAFAGVGAAAARAGNEMVAAGRKGAGALDDVDRKSRKATKGLAGMAGAFGGSDGGGISNAARAIDAFGGASNGATATLGGFRVALAALVPVVVGFGGASIAAAGALGPLIGLAAAGGGVFASLAQGMGVFSLATSGIGAALKEHTANQVQSAGAAINNAGQQRSAARAIQSAQDGLRSSLDGVRQATVGVSDAQRAQRVAVAALAPAYTEARMRLRDLRDAVADTGLALQSSTIAAKEARDALAALVAGASAQALGDAHRAITDALRGEQSAVQSLADAHTALNELLAPAPVLDVAEATDAVADAVRSEERARLALADAIEKTNKVLKDPASSEDAKAKARLDLADAENAVGDAARGTIRVKERLAALEAGPSQGEIAKARQRVSDAELDVADAAKGTADARNALVVLEQPAAAGELVKARLSVAAADNDVAAATRDRTRAVRALAAADALGVKGSAEVVAARDAIKAADRGLADAERDLGDAHRSVARATQAVSDAQLAANESVGGAAAGAAKLTTAMDGLSPPAQAFARQLIALKPKLDELKQTAAAGFFPGAGAGLTAAMGSFESVKKVIGETATVLGEFMRKTGELVGSKAFGKDIEIIGGRNAKVLDTMGEAVRHVLSALRHVLVAAGPLTQWLADTANKWALNAAGAAKAGRESGRLADFFERTRAISERLGSIIGHLTGGLIGVGRAGSQSGNEIWAAIDRASQRFDDWANSVKGQTSLHDFFRRTKELAAALVPVFGGMIEALGLLTLKLLPITAALTILGPLADEATIAFVAYKFAVIGAAVASNIATVATKVWTGAQWLLNAALTANPIGLMIVALVALGAGLVIAYKKVDWFRDIVDNTFRWIKDHWPLLLGIITGPIGLAVVAVVTHWDTIKNATSRVWGAIRDAITGAVRAARDTLGDVLTGITNRINAAWDAIKTATSAAWDSVRDHVLGPVRAARDALAEVFTGIVNRAEGAWETLTKGVADFAGDVKTTIVDAFKGAVNLVIGFLNKLIGAINEIPGVEIGKIKALARGGVVGEEAPGLARGGVVHHDEFAKGGQITRPMVVVGEEAPRFGEYVVPLNPAYRDRARGLFGQLGQDLGIPGFAAGGILGGLPGVGDLPDWLKGTGTYLLRKVKDFIQDKVGGLLGGIGNIFDGGTSLDDTLAAVKRLIPMLSAMNAIDARNFPYVYGGGHGSFAGPYDCSGLISAILHAGGFLDSPITTDGLKVFGEAGDGKWVTVGVRGSTGRQAHAMMKLGSRYLESGSGHGAQWVDGWAGNFPIHRHPAGFARGGILDPEEMARVLGWGLKTGGRLDAPFVGSYKMGGVVPRDGFGLLHQGETVTPPGMAPEVRVFIGDRELTDIIRVEVVERDRRTAGAYNAGVRP